MSNNLIIYQKIALVHREVCSKSLLQVKIAAVLVQNVIRFPLQTSNLMNKKQKILRKEKVEETLYQKRIKI